MSDKKSIGELKDLACEARKNILRLCHKGATHIGGDLSMADVMTVLFQYGMKYNPENPRWPERDRFILSKGHGAGCFYVTLAMAGYFTMDHVLEEFRKFGSHFGEHPSGEIPGIEISTGSLGHGLPISIGMALSARLDGRKNRVFTMMGDGETQEGSVWEGAMASAHYELGNLVAFVDRNRISLDGETEKLMHLEPYSDKWKAFGWNVLDIDGHKIEEIVGAIDSLPPVDSDRPTVVIARTVKGKGVPEMENNVNWHAGSIDDEFLARSCADLDKARGKGE
ncbi:MAG: transketolase [Bacillota bacterium]|nr:transketolase [Bacillota bacterium]